MKASVRKLRLPALALTAALIAGCPLPYEYNGPGAGTSHTTDPSSPSITAPVTVSYSVQGGPSGTVGDGSSFTSGQTTVVTLSTATVNSVIFYTDNGAPLTLTSLASVKKINGSSGEMTLTRTTSLESLDIRAIAIGPNMLPSPAVHATVSVSPYPILSITVDKATVSEAAGKATFTITSSNAAPASGITVSIKTSGGYDASHVSFPEASNTTFTANIPPTMTTTTLDVIGVQNSDHISQTITLAIQPDSSTPPAYSVGAPASAFVVVQDDGTYMVTYDGNGATSGSAPGMALYLPGATVTALGNGSLAKTGYTFAGWNTASNGSGTTYAPGATFTMGSSNVTLYAIWNVIQYTLTVNSSGSGTTSPAGALTVAYGAATSLTATGNAPYIFLRWTVTAGSGAAFGSTGTATSTSASDTVTLTGGNATVQANFFIRDYYVNASTGNDANAGTTSATAFKTITKALSVATVSGQVVHVAAGIYNTAIGETFPLYIPAGVTLTGNTGGLGSGVLIQGGGEPSGFGAGFISNAVVMGNQSVLEGFTITNDSGIASFPQGVLFDAYHSSDGAIVRMNTITGNPAQGIYVYSGSSGGSINNNIFIANPGGDLAFVGGGGNGMSVSYNAFSGLVELDTLGPDLGGGAAGSPGHNSFLGGTNPTYFGSGGTVYAENNHWNNNPPTVGPWGGGFDVGIVNSTIVLTTGSYP